MSVGKLAVSVARSVGRSSGFVGRTAVSVGLSGCRLLSDCRLYQQNHSTRLAEKKSGQI